MTEPEDRDLFDSDAEHDEFLRWRKGESAQGGQLRRVLETIDRIAMADDTTEQSGFLQDLLAEFEPYGGDISLPPADGFGVAAQSIQDAADFFDNRADIHFDSEEVFEHIEALRSQAAVLRNLAGDSGAGPNRAA